MISIVIPTKNEKDFIEKTLRGIQQLTSFPYEIIVSDGKSTDNTREITRLYTDKLVEYNGLTRQTIAMARNAGAAQARGDFLVFIDADVSIPNINNFFEYALSAFAQDEELVALMPWIAIDPVTETFLDRIVLFGFNFIHWLFNNILNRGNGYGEFQMIRTVAFRAVGGYNESIVASEDMEIMMRLSKLGKVRVLHNLVAYHSGRRIHKIGWYKLLPLWISNGISVRFLHHSVSKVWKEVR